MVKKHTINFEEQKTIVEKRSVEVEEGELVMLVKSHKGDPKVSFGVFGGIKTRGLKIISPHYLRPPINFGGITIPNVGLRLGDHIYQLRKDLKLYFGKEDITNELKNFPGFEFYADWVSLLEKPYLRD